MFKMFKKKSIKSPISGKVIELSKIQDGVFSQKIMGEGVAIDSTGDIVYAPINGKIVVVAETKHAFVIELENGMELLIHVGLDTVNLEGEGFDTFIQVGDEVKIGDLLISYDKAGFEQKGINDITMLVIVDPKDYKITEYCSHQDVTIQTSAIIKYK